ncbi:LysR family transcriptional regulator, partial [Shewanella oneidensis]|uniref:LysR family transcriptional regulator n=1 Tax=Shewanella oneidensis TaxID=70863 RepID=UPI002E7C3350
MNKLDRLDIKQLRVFQALIREQSASKAANQLGLTQQAVSERGRSKFCVRLIFKFLARYLNALQNK